MSYVGEASSWIGHHFALALDFLFDYLWTIKDDLLIRDLEAKGWELTADMGWSTRSLHLVHQDLWALSQYEEQGGDRFSFGSLLDVANSAECRDVRDKVYGLVGMMDESIATLLVPDYSSAPSKISATVARFFITAHQNLHSLCDENP